MHTAGIIGGIGPEATVDYYRSIVGAYRAAKPDRSYPAVIINSIELNRMLELVEANALDALAGYLSSEVLKLANAGADFGVFASNTPHLVFDEIHRRSPIPLISIVEAACDAAKALGLTKLGLLGSRFTMQGRFYPKVFSKAEISLVVPEREEQTYIHDKYMNELVNGIFLPETRARLLSIVDRLKEREKIQGLILGGTELPLILRDVPDCGIHFLDTTQIHVKTIVERLLS